MGNRTVSSGDVWGVVLAATRAFPIQLSPSVEKAQQIVAEAAGAAGSTQQSDLLHTWILQVRAVESLPANSSFTHCMWQYECNGSTPPPTPSCACTSSASLQRHQLVQMHCNRSV